MRRPAGSGAALGDDLLGGEHRAAVELEALGLPGVQHLQPGVDRQLGPHAGDQRPGADHADGPGDVGQQVADGVGERAAAQQRLDAGGAHRVGGTAAGSIRASTRAASAATSVPVR